MMRGFTLIEVLVAMALMALLSLIGWKALDVVERSSSRVAAHADDTLDLQRVMGQIARDIEQHANLDVLPSAQPENTPPNAGAPRSPAQTATTPVQPLPPGISLDKQSVTLVRAQASGAWQQVRWYVARDALYRATGAANTSLPLPQPDHEHAVLQNIRAFDVRAWLPGRGWTAPPLPAPSAAASGLEIVLVRSSAQGDETYRNVVLLP